MAWDPPPRPAELAESRLIDAFLDGQFPIQSTLPPERDLAVQLGVTRPTLREALQRLARDGWIEIRHGRPTRVRDYWNEGSLGVLGAISRHLDHLPSGFVPNLLSLRLVLAPAYTRLAIRRFPRDIAELLESYSQLPDDPDVFAAADWHLHLALTIASGNPVFTLILNTFADLYHTMARRYFAGPQTRSASRAFYGELLAAARNGDPAAAERAASRAMSESVELWESLPADRNRDLP